MSERKRTVSGSSTATQPPPYSAVPPSATSFLPVLGTVRRTIETPRDDEEDDDDYIPFLDGKDHPEYVAGRNNPFKGITQKEMLEGKPLSSREAYVIVKERVAAYVQSHPLKEREFTPQDRKRMDKVALKLYQAVGEGKAKLVQYSAPSIFEECACACEK